MFITTVPPRHHYFFSVLFEFSSNRTCLAQYYLALFGINYTIPFKKKFLKKNKLFLNLAFEVANEKEIRNDEDVPLGQIFFALVHFECLMVNALANSTTRSLLKIESIKI